MRWKWWGVFGCIAGSLALAGGTAWRPWPGRAPAGTAVAVAAQTAAAPRPERQPVRMIAVGDLMLGSRGRSSALSRSPRSLFARHRGTVRKADLAFGNLETPLSERGSPTPGKSKESLRKRTNFIFRAPTAAAEGLAWAGFDVLSVANNHTMDYGAVALEDTLACLREAGIQSVGGGAEREAALAPAFLERNHQRFAFFGISDVLPLYSAADRRTPGVAPARGPWFEERMPEAIAQARQLADWVLVSVHWGKERFTGATEKQKRLGHRLIDWGADVVIGHHTHVLGPVEHYGDGIIHYSLGNFIGPRSRKGPSPAWEIVFRPGERPTERTLILP